MSSTNLNHSFKLLIYQWLKHELSYDEKKLSFSMLNATHFRYHFSGNTMTYISRLLFFRSTLKVFFGLIIISKTIYLTTSYNLSGMLFLCWTKPLYYVFQFFNKNFKNSFLCFFDKNFKFSPFYLGLNKFLILINIDNFVFCPKKNWHVLIPIKKFQHVVFSPC